jgi:hypothetical protein
MNFSIETTDNADGTVLVRLIHDGRRYTTIIEKSEIEKMYGTDVDRTELALIELLCGVQHKEDVFGYHRVDPILFRTSAESKTSIAIYGKPTCQVTPDSKKLEYTIEYAHSVGPTNETKTVKKIDLVLDLDETYQPYSAKDAEVGEIET